MVGQPKGYYIAEEAMIDKQQKLAEADQRFVEAVNAR
jgi:hypothetical protein